jgi:hypothetical protein
MNTRVGQWRPCLWLQMGIVYVECSTFMLHLKPFRIMFDCILLGSICLYVDRDFRQLWPSSFKN